jgi:hypothetical protein
VCKNIILTSGQSLILLSELYLLMQVMNNIKIRFAVLNESQYEEAVLEFPSTVLIS